MSLLDYAVKRDNFEAEEYGWGFNFPCNVCVHRVNAPTDEPCCKCDHNESADQD